MAPQTLQTQLPDWLGALEPHWLEVLPPSVPLAVVAGLVVGDLVLRVVAVAVVPANRRPSSALAWLLAIFFVPYIGVAAFLVIGSPKLPRKRRDKQQQINELIMKRTSGIDLVTKHPRWPSWLAQLARLNRHLGALPLVEGNRATLHADYEESIKAMTAEVDAAARYVHVEFYILSYDEATEQFFDAMERATSRGVTVRVLFDHVASLRIPGYGATTRRLSEMGAIWHPMLPLQPLKGRWQRPDLRNHRKLLVVDGEVAWTGSQNLIDREYHKRRYSRRALEWQDLMMRLTGPVVAEVNTLFLTDWYSETDDLLEAEAPRRPPTQPSGQPDLDCQVVPSGPGFDGENNLKLFNALFYYAAERIVITSPYFVPDDSLLYAITTAAERGVAVELFVSEIGDQWMVFHAQRSYYEALLRSGVRIWLYPAPYILHAKHVSIDDSVAVVGSSNLDMRSFSLDLEVSVLVHGTQFVAALRDIENSYRRVSRELTLAQWQQRPFVARLHDNVARLTSALQ